MADSALSHMHVCMYMYVRVYVYVYIYVYIYIHTHTANFHHNFKPHATNSNIPPPSSINTNQHYNMTLNLQYDLKGMSAQELPSGCEIVAQITEKSLFKLP